VRLLDSRGLFLGVVVVVLVSALVVRAVVASRAELSTARMFHEEGELRRATEHYRRALRWWFPLSPYEARAASALESIAEELERSGDRAGALLAWRSLAGGVAAARLPWDLSSRAREEAKDEIARLVALEGGAPIDANLDENQLAAQHRRLLDREVSPDPLWGTILLLGFAVWIGSLVLLMRRGFDYEGHLRPSRARGALWAALGGWVSFVLGLLFG
jgi:hypothetical protein